MLRCLGVPDAPPSRGLSFAGQLCLRHRRCLALLMLLTAITTAPFVGATVYEVGAGRNLARISDVPWAGLLPGDQVSIHWQPTPYKEKWVVFRPGSDETPIVIRGVPGPNGQLPVIDGREAVTAGSWIGENRAVVKIGNPDASQAEEPRHIVLEDLEIVGALPSSTFQGSRGAAAYLSYAAAIWVEKGSDITIRHCVLRDCANGLITSHQSSRILVEKCRIYDNGLDGGTQEHNSYTESAGIVFQFNRIGPLRAGSLGNALKDRSSGTVIRYNWIEGGSRLLDLVDSDYAHLRDDPAYSKSYVYGNVLIKDQSGANNQLVHYGGDSGREERYRRGTLYFYHNTAAIYRNSVLFRTSNAAESVEAVNNLVCAAAPGIRLAVLSGAGRVTLEHNLLPLGWKPSFDSAPDALLRSRYNIATEPGLANVSSRDFRLTAGSPARAAGRPLSATINESQPVLFEYCEPVRGVARPSDIEPDLGAISHAESGSVTPPGFRD